MVTPMTMAIAEPTDTNANQSVYKLFFLCEDWAAREKALALKESLASNCEGRVALEATFCSFARLCHPKLREKARQDIESTDMFILSASGTHGLPMFVQQWLNTFSPPKKPMACAEFFQPGISESFAHHFMERWSRNMGTEFFSNCKGFATGTLSQQT